MKPILKIIFSALLLIVGSAICTAANYTPILYSSERLTGFKSTNTVLLVPYPTPNTITIGGTGNTNFVAGFPVTLYPDTNGIAMTNLAPNQYRMLISGLTVGVIVEVPDTTNRINLADYVNSGATIYTYTNNILGAFKTLVTDTAWGYLAEKIRVIGSLSMTTNSSSGQSFLVISNSVGSATNSVLIAGGNNLISIATNVGGTSITYTFSGVAQTNATFARTNDPDALYLTNAANRIAGAGWTNGSLTASALKATDANKGEQSVSLLGPLTFSGSTLSSYAVSNGDTRNLFLVGSVSATSFAGTGIGLSNLVQASYAQDGAVGSNVYKAHLASQINEQYFPFVPIGLTTWEANGTAISNVTITNILIAASAIGLNTIAGKYGGLHLNIDDGWQTNDLINGHVIPHPSKFPNFTNTITYIHSFPNVKAMVYTEPRDHSSSGLAGAGTNLITFAQDMFNFGVDDIHLDQPGIQTQPMIENSHVIMTSFRGYASNKLSLGWFGPLWAGTNTAVESSVPPGSIIRVHTDWGGYITTGAGNWTNFFLQDVLYRIDTFDALANAHGRDRWVMSGALFSAIPNLPTVEQVIVGWYAMTAQPMFFTHLSTYTGNALLTNNNIFMIQQDPLRYRAHPLPANTNVWVKRLVDGVAVGFLNRSTNSSANIGVSWQELGFDPADVMDVINVWGLSSTTATGTLTNSTASMSMDIFILRPAKTFFLSQSKQFPVFPFDATSFTTQPSGGYGINIAPNTGVSANVPAEMFQNGHTTIVTTLTLCVRSNATYPLQVQINAYSKTNRFQPASVTRNFFTGHNNPTNFTIITTNTMASPDGNILGVQVNLYYSDVSTGSVVGWIQGTVEAR